MSDSPEAAIETLVTRFYSLFTNADGRVPDVEGIHDLFIPQGLIVSAVGASPTIYDLASFVEPRKRILTDGTLVEFEEYETRSEMQIFGDIAVRISWYAKHGVRAGERFEGTGVKTMQFVQTGDGWRFSATSWFDD